jgi:hypothetical protein
LNAAEDILAVGCEDGYVRLFDVSHDGLEFSKALPGSNGSEVSLQQLLLLQLVVPLLLLLQLPLLLPVDLIKSSFSPRNVCSHSWLSRQK